MVSAAACGHRRLSNMVSLHCLSKLRSDRGLSGRYISIDGAWRMEDEWMMLMEDGPERRRMIENMRSEQGRYTQV